MDTEHVDVVINGGLWAGVQVVKLLAWPAVVAFFILVIRPHLGPLIESLSRRRVKFKGPLGTEAEFDAVEQQQKPGGNPVIVKPADEITAPPRLSEPQSASVAHIEQEVLKILEKAEVNDPAKQVPLLLRDLANTRVRAGHEYVYNRIFGSQIAFLKRLDEQGPCSAVEAKTFFDQYAERFPEQLPGYGFDRWLGFLSSNLLIEVEGVGWKTTVYGHDFLVYIAQNSMSADKWL